jgi:hypothetical protein
MITLSLTNYLALLVKLGTKSCPSGVRNRGEAHAARW